MKKNYYGHVLEKLQNDMHNSMQNMLIEQRQPPGFSPGTFSNQPTAFSADIAGLLAARYAGKTERFDQVAVRAFWFVIEGVKAEPSGDQAIKLEITSLVADRDTGTPLRIVFTRVIDKDSWATPEGKLAHLRDVMRSWLLHELDENLLLNDRRVFDPHAPAVPSVPFMPAPESETDPFRYYASSHYLKAGR